MAIQHRERKHTEYEELREKKDSMAYDLLYNYFNTKEQFNRFRTKKANRDRLDEALKTGDFYNNQLLPRYKVHERSVEFNTLLRVNGSADPEHMHEYLNSILPPGYCLGFNI